MIGFIKGSFISESTRLVHNIMNYTEKKNLDGLIMLIDCEKAFDLVSWKFIFYPSTLCENLVETRYAILKIECPEVA